MSTTTQAKAPMTRPRLLDLFCCQGGAAMGYHRAGFEVIGIDISPQPNYPFTFHQLDVTALRQDVTHGCWHESYIHSSLPGRSVVCLGRFDAVHASPPCQAHTRAQKLRGNEHPDLVAPVRDLLIKSGLPYVIENVEGAPLIDPVMLCGPMFGLETYRHRLFESNIELTAPAHPDHLARNTKMGRAPVEGEFMHVVGNFSGVDKARQIMDMPWANRDGLREAIPPAYTEFLGQQLMEARVPA